VNKISDKDKKDWEKFVSNNEKLPNKDSNFKEKKIRTQRSLDLHGYSLDEANKKVNDFIKTSYQEGIERITVVTGKGLHSTTELDPFVSKDLSILKYSVPNYIKNNDDLIKLIIDFKEANIKDGGSGAFYINLKKNK
tara:strand:- start:101 stop:511 length:411 start_codon:yes stop_codon:yes gene_type:complete